MSISEEKLLKEVEKGKVISVFRNHEELKYPYGTKTKQCFRLRSQLFEG